MTRHFPNKEFMINPMLNRLDGLHNHFYSELSPSEYFITIDGIGFRNQYNLHENAFREWGIIGTVITKYTSSDLGFRVGGNRVLRVYPFHPEQIPLCISALKTLYRDGKRRTTIQQVKHHMSIYRYTENIP
jgi:hypothetical protein